jgi:hypothetical protein
MVLQISDVEATLGKLKPAFQFYEYILEQWSPVLSVHWTIVTKYELSKNPCDVKKYFW